MGKYTRQNFMLGVIAGTPVLAAFFVGLRYYGRWRAKIKLAADDHLILFALALSLAVIWPSFLNVKMWHKGVHIWHVNQKRVEPDFDDFHKVQVSFNMLNIPILPIVKTSIIILLLRIGSVLTSIRRLLYAIFAFNLLSSFVVLICALLLCPLRTGGTNAPHTWGGARCIGTRRTGRIYVFAVSANLFTDLLLFPIPFLMIWRLQHTKKREKVLATVSFSLSLLATILGILRLKYTYQSIVFRRHISDWTYPIDWCLHHAENNTAIMAACMPAIQNLIAGWSKRRGRGSSANRSGGSGNTSNKRIKGSRSTGNNDTLSSMEKGSIGVTGTEGVLKGSETFVEEREFFQSRETRRKTVEWRRVYIAEGYDESLFEDGGDIEEVSVRSTSRRVHESKPKTSEDEILGIAEESAGKKKDGG